MIEAQSYDEWKKDIEGIVKRSFDDGLRSCLDAMRRFAESHPDMSSLEVVNATDDLIKRMKNESNPAV